MTVHIFKYRDIRIYTGWPHMGSQTEHRHPLDPLYDQFAQVFQSLSNPKRLHVLRCLNEREKSVTEILACKAFAGVPQSTVSQNLASLRNLGLVKARKEGTNVFYRLSDPRIVGLLELVGELVRQRASEVQEVAQGL